MMEEATKLAAMRSGKVDALGLAFGWTQIGSIDQIDSLKRTNPELQFEPLAAMSNTSFTVNTQARRPLTTSVCATHCRWQSTSTKLTRSSGGVMQTTHLRHIWGQLFSGMSSHLKIGPKRLSNTTGMTRQGQKRCLMKLGLPAARTALDSRPPS